MLGKRTNFKETIGSLKETYKGIDCRAIIAKKDNELKCIFLKIRLTRQTREEVEAIYKEKVRCLGEVNSDKFLIVMEYCELSELDRILQEIGNKVITIAGVQYNLQFTKNGIFADEILEDDEYTTLEERQGFPHFCLANPMERLPVQLLNTLGIGQKEMGMQFEDVLSFLDVSKTSYTFNVTMLFPLYFKKIEISEMERKSTLAKFRVHKNIVGSLSAAVKVVHGTTTGTRWKHELKDLVVNSNEDILEVALPVPGLHSGC